MKGRERKILGIVGPPGCGKSTLTEALLSLLGESAVVVPMDGYHLANVELVTASLQSGGRVPGLPQRDAEALRDRLIAIGIGDQDGL